MLSLLKRQDWLLTASILVLLAASLVTLASIAEHFFIAQFLWAILGLVAMLGVALMDIRPLANHRAAVFIVYSLAIALLLATFVFGTTIRHAKSWIVFGPVQFQTSEFAKLALIIILAYFFSREHVGIARLGNIFRSALYFGFLAILVFFQPDFGTVLVLFAIWAAFLLVSGIRWRHLLIGLVLLLCLGLIAWNGFLKPYQKERLRAFADPQYDPLGVNYGVIQAKIAVGSAGVFGKGFKQGTQVQLGFLPEATADFILPAFIEEWGLLGAAVLLAAFAILVFRIIRIGLLSHNNFSKLLCLGAASMFLIQFFFNAGSALGFLPVVGVTFPFFSYGGSSLLINMILVGILQGIAIRASFFRE